jgi:hypothetical protein
MGKKNNQQNDTRDALKDIFYSLKDVFKKYSRSSRKKAWNKTTTPSGKDIIEKMINNPSIPLRGLDRLIFKENFLEWSNKPRN